MHLCVRLQPPTETQPIGPVSNGPSSTATTVPTATQEPSAPGAPSTAPSAQVPRASPMPPAQQAQPQFPPGVKVPEQTLQAAIGTPQQQGPPQGVRPPSAAPSQLSQQPRPTSANAFAGSLSDLVMSFESVKQKGM